MRRTWQVARAFALCVSVMGLQAMAQATPQAQGGNRPATPAGPPQTMDLETAKKIVSGAEAAAAAMNQHVAICVMDTNGDVVLAERMNGTNRIPQSTAQGKARAVLMFGVPTAQIAESIQNKKPMTATITALPVGTGGGEVTVMRGGLPVMKDGKLIGAVGVGGSASESDEQFAQAGIDALKGK